MRQPRLYAGVLFWALLIVLIGCAGGSKAPVLGRVILRHESPEDVRTLAQQMRITCLDGRSRVLHKGQVIDVASLIDMPGVPGSTTSLLIEYLRDGMVIAETVAEIDLSDGKEEVGFGGNPVGYVHFVKNDSGYTIMVGSNKVFIKGVGFDYTQLDQDSSGSWFSYVDPAIAKVGANCIRLYGLPWTDGGVATPGSPAYQAQFTSDMLAFAARNGMYVLVGVFVDGSATTSRVTSFIQAIQSDPNFSRVIGYCVGNEVGEGFFSTVNSLAATIKTLSPTAELIRPIMTALPAVSSGYVATIQSEMPNLDWLGVNSFYGQFDSTHAGGGYLNTQAASLSSGGWTKPWAITEYYSYDIQSPQMPNQVLNGASLGYMLECNSTLNAQNYANSYTQYIASTDAIAKGSVGGFVLNFGPPHNSKLVASWLEPFAYTGQFTPFVNPPWNNGANQFIRLSPTDAIAGVYGGSFGGQCPQIVLGDDGDPQGISCNFKATLTSPGLALDGGTSQTASVKASSANALTFAWYLIGGSSGSGYSGDITAPGLNPQAYEQPTTIYLGSGTSTSLGNNVTENTITFNLPTPQQNDQNNYQLRVIVFDQNLAGATAAIGFAMNLTQPPAPPPEN